MNPSTLGLAPIVVFLVVLAILLLVWYWSSITLLVHGCYSDPDDPEMPSWLRLIFDRKAYERDKLNEKKLDERFEEEGLSNK